MVAGGFQKLLDVKLMRTYEPRIRLNEVVELVYDQLRGYASRALEREPGGLTLQTTELVHEAYLRLSELREIDWDDDRQIVRAAVGVMRRVLIDYARARRSLKRTPPGIPRRIDENMIWASDDDTLRFDLLDLDEALEKLALFDSRKAKLVELRYFGGFNDQQVADSLGVSLSTIKRDWKFAKAWLFRELNAPPRHD